MLPRTLKGLLLAAGIALALGNSLGAQASPFTNLYVFGDSLSDNGNLFIATGGTIPNPTYYYPGRFQNGPSYAEHLWNNLGFAGSLAPVFAGGTNFAVGGARTSYHVSDLDSNGLPPPTKPTPPSPGFTFSLNGQLATYNSIFGGISDPNALYVVWSGSNDLQDVLTLAGMNNMLGAQNRLVEAVNDVASVVGTLVGNGARSIFLPTVPDLGLVPAVMASGAQASHAGTLYSQAFNAGLDQALANFMTMPDLDIIRFDVFHLLQDLVNDPSAYGLTNVTGPCQKNYYVNGPIDSSLGVPLACSNPDEYLFWDVVHPSAKTHSILGQLMAEAVPEPATLALVMIGFAGLVLSHRKYHAG